MADIILTEAQIADAAGTPALAQQVSDLSAQVVSLTDRVNILEGAGVPGPPPDPPPAPDVVPLVQTYDVAESGSIIVSAGVGQVPSFAHISYLAPEASGPMRAQVGFETVGQAQIWRGSVSCDVTLNPSLMGNLPTEGHLKAKRFHHTYGAGPDGEGREKIGWEFYFGGDQDRIHVSAQYTDASWPAGTMGPGIFGNSVQDMPFIVNGPDDFGRPIHVELVFALGTPGSFGKLELWVDGVMLQGTDELPQEAHVGCYQGYFGGQGPYFGPNRGPHRIHYDNFQITSI